MVPIKQLAQNDGTVAYGSDWDNVPEPNPWLALQTMITRQNPAQPELGVLAAEQRVDLDMGLKIMTIHGAKLMELEKVTGSIEVGKDADMIVLDQNLYKIPSDKIIDTKVLRTILKGKTIYQEKK